ncbi:hypothetical protein [Luteipulveratus mongoliensis]|uniref:Uncharacterized protein n=1 Tax=Luteipulveratus mongoliensis TaxID=571913 RepID=A0A0K1JL41_9MICO|nr:hypothetical protein [Luteipulveratus mongoliensis]AKU17293.1 hypothetical protein VV02_17940 [Luteipulveratus mongoliensis]
MDGLPDIPNWISWLLVLLTLVGIGLAVWPIVRKDFGRINVTSRWIPIIDGRVSGPVPKIEVVVDGERVYDPWLLEVRVRNTGRKDLSKDDFGADGDAIGWTFQDTLVLAIPNVSFPLPTTIPKAIVSLIDLSLVDESPVDARLEPLILKTGEELVFTAVCNGGPGSVRTIDRVANFRFVDGPPGFWQRPVGAIIRDPDIRMLLEAAIGAGVAVVAVTLAVVTWLGGS